MKYVIEATGNMGEDKSDYGYTTIPIELELGDVYEDTAVIFTLPNGTEWWIPVEELSELMEIIDTFYEQ